MRVIIVGSVAAGMSVAGKLSREGEGVSHVVYERRAYSSLGACSIPFYVGGHIDSSEDLLARTNEQHIKAGINLKTRHEVIEIISKKRKVIVKNLDTGKTFEDKYDKLVLATGAGPVVPPIPGVKELENIFTATTKGDAEKIHKAARDGTIQKVVVVGAGFIGIEMAEALTELGKDVRVIEFANRPVANVFDPEMTNVLTEGLKKHVHLHLSEKVTEFKGTGIVKKVVTNKGEYDADMVIMSVGFKPNTNISCDNEFLRLKNGALAVNSYMKTTIRDIYACGDCATVNDRITGESVWIPLATTARKTGKYVANHIMGKGVKAFEGTLGTSGFRFHDYEIFRTGLTTQQAADLNIPITTTHIKLSDHINMEGVTPLEGKIITEFKTGKIIGAQFVGHNKGAAIRCAAMAGLMWNGITDKELVDFDFFYTPPFSKATDILHILGGASLKSRTKQ